jgi:hypothetical protein
MKFGIDIHGVADKKKKFFAIFSQRAITNGHEVHIVTGSLRTPEIEKELHEYGIHYTHFFSISDKLLKECKVTHWTSPNNPWFHENDWNSAKGKYCSEQGIDLQFDDSLEYGKYFTSTYVRVI